MSLKRTQIVKILVLLFAFMSIPTSTIWAAKLPPELLKHLQQVLSKENSKIQLVDTEQKQKLLHLVVDPIVDDYFKKSQPAQWRRDLLLVVEIDQLIESSTITYRLPPLEAETRQAWLISQFQLLAVYGDQLENHAEALTHLGRATEAKMINSQAEYVIQRLTLLYRKLQDDQMVTSAEHETAIQFYYSQSLLGHPIDQAKNLLTAARNHFRELTAKRQLELQDTGLDMANVECLL